MKSWLLKLATKGKKGKTITSVKPFSSINAPYNIGAGTKRWSADRRAQAAKTLQISKRYDKRSPEAAAKIKAAEAKKLDEYKPSGKFKIKKKKSWTDQIDTSHQSYKDKWPG